MAAHESRTPRLRVHFRKVLSGELLVRNIREGKLFIESLCSQPDPVSSVQSLISSLKGIVALQLALSADLTRKSLNEGASALLSYLQAPGLKVIGGGQFLQKIVILIVNPPVFWDAFFAAQKAGQLTTETTRCFSWLLLQLVSLPVDQATAYRLCADDVSIQRMLLESFDSETRMYAQKIKHILEATSRPDQDTGDTSPGGRHDNDHYDINKITILPTPDEINCNDDPFLRRAADVEQISGPGRLLVFLDNHFRLLREDMLRDLREELPVALGLKKGRRRGLMLQNLKLLGVDCDERSPWSLQIQCSNDLPQMPNSDEKKRKAFLKEKCNYLRNGSLACLVVDNEVAALVTIRRNEDLLAKIPPLICVVT